MAMTRLKGDEILRNNYDGTYSLIRKDGTQTLVQKFKMNDGHTYTDEIKAGDAAYKSRVPYGNKTYNPRLPEGQDETGYTSPPPRAGGLPRYGADGAGVYNRAT